MVRLKTNNNRTMDTALFVLLLAQPLLDVFSYFMIQLQMTTISSLVRMALFAGITLFCFWTSDNRKPYYIMAAVLGGFWAVHMVGCFAEGYQSIIQDMMQYIRTVQMPVLVLCFIDIFKKCDDAPRVIQKAFVCIYCIISGVIALSYLVGDPVYTYVDVGIKGWFATGNAQSCIVSLLAPLSILYAVKSENKIHFAGITLLAFLNMFWFGTRVTYYLIFVTIIGIVFFMLVNKKKNIFQYCFLAGCLVVGLLCYRVSPCYINQNLSNGSMQEWQTEIDSIANKNPDDPQKPAVPLTKEEHFQQHREDYLEIYNLYSSSLVERFGLDRVVEQYDYSLNASDLISNRKQKLAYSELIMAEKGTMQQLFGFEYMGFINGDEIYDPENDFPAIYFSNGIVGLVMYIGFLAYFVILILRKLIADFKHSLTMENGMVAITMVMIVGAAQLSGNVLRRPNVSIYLSLILAYVFYLCVIKKKEDRYE